MRVGLTVMLTKCAAGLSRLTGRGQGQALPGLVAERFDPDLAAKLVRNLSHGVILITGTNGKTTTTKLVASMLEANGERVLTNNTGSNLKRGVTSALIAGSNWRGQLRNYTIGLFEVDEASMPKVASQLHPRAIVVLNLFRDQLDRYGELDTTAAMLGRGIASTNAELHLNADDPLVASLARYASAPEKVYFFGIEGLPVGVGLGENTAIDSDRCPICNTRLEFSRVFYAHIGHYRCVNGHFPRPHPSVAVTGVDSAGVDGTQFSVAMNGKRREVFLPIPGTYNLYNALAALSIANSLGLDQRVSVDALTTFMPAFGRVERIEVDGRILYLLLIKNPAGFTQVLQTFLIGQTGARVLMAINDLAADGRDVSWLWDVPLEALAPAQPAIIATGIRASDMALRLHYAGIEADLVDGFEPAIQQLLDTTPVGATAYLLPTYTAMIAIRKVLSKLTQLPEMGQ
jgi:lipid II isoglutaminyl synthase (glutamine-hydrolysing)